MGENLYRQAQLPLYRKAAWGHDPKIDACCMSMCIKYK